MDVLEIVKPYLLTLLLIGVLVLMVYAIIIGEAIRRDNKSTKR